LEKDNQCHIYTGKKKNKKLVANISKKDKNVWFWVTKNSNKECSNYNLSH